ncbi:unnamed protein product [Bursaphelenchus xylophilus]|uniref:(pine wood nematode) hypothetical protein n=1 Tax=Bursaphelenchus xylophilus TaxID=6326 RepID=A0A1I7RI40_BURXY|nr:unnamed protein product [Bursaphelenchus xylophilus]CAG9115172.1 unnamed protein product [Bursaphelenchus xylophilus]
MLTVCVILVVSMIAEVVSRPELYHWQRRSMDCAWVDYSSPITQCALRGSDWHFSDFGQDCFEAFDPASKTIQNLCPLNCQKTDEAVILGKIPSNSHKCAQHFNYGLRKHNDDVVLWRSGVCLNETLRFEVRCGFPFSQRDFVSAKGLLSSVL